MEDGHTQSSRVEDTQDAEADNACSAAASVPDIPDVGSGSMVCIDAVEECAWGSVDSHWGRDTGTLAGIEAGLVRVCTRGMSWVLA